MRTAQFELLHPDEILEEQRKCPLVFLAFGPLEWHGPHLPLGTDALIAHEVALRVARITGGVVMPPVYWGTERERDPDTLEDLGFSGEEWIVGMDFPANSLKSLYIEEEIFALGVRSWLDQCIQLGYRVIAIINGHGASNQLSTLERLAVAYQNSRKVEVITAFVAVPDEQGSVDYGHAAGAETSKILAIDPRLVDVTLLPPSGVPLSYRDWAIVDSDAFLGDPEPGFHLKDDPRSTASKERGEALLGQSVGHITRLVNDRLRHIGWKEAQR